MDVRIDHLTGPELDALTRGDFPASDYLLGPQCHALWLMRSEQVRADPAAAAWVTGIVRDAASGTAVGAAGFHGPPDATGMVEVGYRIDPLLRRRGYARAALEALLARAAREPEVSRVRASISPDNHASYGLVAQYGFVRVGDQWDDEDGLEIVYELPA